MRDTSTAPLGQKWIWRKNVAMWAQKKLHETQKELPKQGLKLQELEGKTTARVKLEAIIWSSGYSYRVQTKPIGAKLGALQLRVNLSRRTEASPRTSIAARGPHKPIAHVLETHSLAVYHHFTRRSLPRAPILRIHEHTTAHHGHKSRNTGFDSRSKGRSPLSA
jgi:hypothetical protein